MKIVHRDSPTAPEQGQPEGKCGEISEIFSPPSPPIFLSTHNERKSCHHIPVPTAHFNELIGEHSVSEFDDRVSWAQARLREGVERVLRGILICE